MAENQYNSKIVLSSGEVLMDLTQDTVVADKLLKGFTAHGKDGAPITGSCEFDADTGDATAGAAKRPQYRPGQALRRPVRLPRGGGGEKGIW